MCKGELLEVKDGNVKTQPAVLENLVFFVEVCLHPPEGTGRASHQQLTLSHLTVWDLEVISHHFLNWFHLLVTATE